MSRKPNSPNHNRLACAPQDSHLTGGHGRARSPGYVQGSDSIWMGLGRRHARNGKNIHNSAFPPSRHLYSQLLLQDFNKDFMLISKHTESCRLNIVSWLAAAAVAAAAAAVAAATILWLWLPAAVLLPLSGAEFWPTVPRLHYHAVWR